MHHFSQIAHVSAQSILLTEHCHVRVSVCLCVNVKKIWKKIPGLSVTLKDTGALHPPNPPRLFSRLYRRYEVLNKNRTYSLEAVCLSPQNMRKDTRSVCHLKNTYPYRPQQVDGVWMIPQLDIFFLLSISILGYEDNMKGTMRPQQVGGVWKIPPKASFYIYLLRSM